MQYKTIKERSTAEIVEKKSKFIANIFHIESREEAEQIISNIKKEYYDARHNCFAYSFYDEKSMQIYTRSSDDGEPSGTAGVPILSVVNGNNLVNVLIIVTRYFGGILLGTGGLVRAYKEAAEKVIINSKMYKIVEGYEVKTQIDYNNWDKFNYYCKNKKINIIKTEYFEKIECIFEIPKENFENENLFFRQNDIVRQKLIISDF